jgi:hypothetical protein
MIWLVAAALADSALGGTSAAFAIPNTAIDAAHTAKAEAYFFIRISPVEESRH